ncbi:MAG: sodium-dependent transporter [Anaerovoracaceae bacterium]
MRDRWNSKLGFLLAAIGSAVGLGNIWRFPYTAFENGGGAFMIPYFIAILTAGIPILILEYTIGKTYRGSAPVALARINKKFEWLGWAQVMVAFMITIYYFAIVVWVVSYMGFALTQKWGADPAGFFFGEYLGLTDSPFQLGGIQTGLIIPFLIVWVITSVILFRGISKGIELACKILLPILLLMIIILVIRGITLPGASDGLNYLFAPDWSALLKGKVWVAAYGQIFFSLSIAFAIMIAYSSYLPKKTDVVNSAFITATANHGFEVLAGIGVFSILGYMAAQQGVTVPEVAGGGVGLAFITFPTAISALPGLNGFFGLCFFLALFAAGITSLVSIMQAVIAGMQDKFKMPHKKAVTIVLVPAFILSLFFITGAGLLILDVVDEFINKVGITGCGLIEIILIGWFFNPEEIRKAANEYSNFSVGKWWTWCIKLVTVLILGISLGITIFGYFTEGYGGYDSSVLLVFGLGAILLVIIGAIILTAMKGKDGYRDLSKEADKEVE